MIISIYMTCIVYLSKKWKHLAIGVLLYPLNIHASKESGMLWSWSRKIADGRYSEVVFEDRWSVLKDENMQKPIPWGASLIYFWFVTGLYRKGLVYLDVSIKDDDCIIGKYSPTYLASFITKDIEKKTSILESFLEITNISLINLSFSCWT